MLYLNNATAEAKAKRPLHRRRAAPRGTIENVGCELPDCSWKSLFTTGDLFGAEFSYRELPKKLDVFDTAAFEANPLEISRVCHDPDTMQRVYDLGREAANRASQALAGMS